MSLLDIIFPWVLDTYTRHVNHSKKPFIIGIQGPQGIGKSTLVHSLQQQLSSSPTRPLVVTTSMDDYYLTHQDQQASAHQYPDNPLLQYRGNPGTHDVALAMDHVHKVQQQCSAESIAFPIYNKALNQGRGDRLIESRRVLTTRPIDILIIEGWCFGFHPHSNEFIHHQYSSHPLLSSLLHMNTLLSNYLPWFHSVNAIIQLKAEDIHYVYEWRWQQEVESNQGKLSRDQVNDFVDRFMPAYELYSDSVIPGYSDSIPSLVITLNLQRIPI